MEDLLFLIRYLCHEKKGLFIDYRIDNFEEAKDLYRKLCIARLPIDVTDYYLEIESRFLKSELQKRGIVEWNTLFQQDKIGLWFGDITRFSIGAIVNPISSSMLDSFPSDFSSFNDSIYYYAGVSLKNEFQKILENRGNISGGEVILTSSYHLPCDFVFHVLLSMFHKEILEQQKFELEQCYIHCLDFARINGIRTIAFPCVSTDFFSFSMDTAAKIAVSTIQKYLEKYDDYFDFILFCIDDMENYSYYEELI